MVEWLRSWLRAILIGESRILAELQEIRWSLYRIERTMATQTDIDALNARLSAAEDARAAAVANIRQDIANLKAANPGIDTTALEATVARVEAGVTDETELDEENPPAAPVEPSVDEV